MERAHNIDSGNAREKEDTIIINSIYEGLDQEKKKILLGIIKLFGQEVDDGKKTGNI